MSGRIVQFDLFANEKILQQNMEEQQFKKNITKSIRGLFARYNEMEIAILDMHKRLDRVSEETFKVQ